MLFPKVKKQLSENGYYSFSEKISVSTDEVGDFDKAMFNTVFGSICEEGNLVISCKKEVRLSKYSDEAYVLRSQALGDVLYIDIKAVGNEALIRALFTIKRMLLKNEFILGEIADWPSFSVRGYIEGFYGKPWKIEERLEMMELMALFGENTHYYAPKDDPYHRSKWNENYPERELQELKSLVDKAGSLYIKFSYCIAPGLSMKYCSDEDFDALCRKTKQLYSIGIRSFGLLLDDIPSDLFYEEDKEKYKNAAAAHVELVGRYYHYLKSLSPSCVLTVCPTAYHGKGNEEEITAFASNVPEDVLVFFTGSDICSKELTLKEAEVFYENNRHYPLYWDNYPVNDAEMFMEMHTGPIIGREPDLHLKSAGLISNCMEYFNCNKFPLITIAAYLWNSECYEPEEAYREAVDFLLEGDDREDFMLLSDHFRTTCLKDENSRIMGQYLSEASVLFMTGHKEKGIEVVKDFAAKINSAADRLSVKEEPLYKELSRWIRKFLLMRDILNISISVLEGEDRKDELKALMDEYNESATVLTAFCFREYIEGVLDI